MPRRRRGYDASQGLRWRALTIMRISPRSAGGRSTRWRGWRSTLDRCCCWASIRVSSRKREVLLPFDSLCFRRLQAKALCESDWLHGVQSDAVSRASRWLVRLSFADDAHLGSLSGWPARTASSPVGALGSFFRGTADIRLPQVLTGIGYEKVSRRARHRRRDNSCVLSYSSTSCTKRRA